MKVECSKEKLNWAIQVANRATNKSLTLPVLSNVILEVDSGKMFLRSTNLDIFIEVLISCKTEKNGVLAVSADALIGFLSSISKETTINLESVDGNLIIKSKSGRATIKGVPFEDFPKMTKPSGDIAFKIEASSLSDGIKSVSYSASSSQIKPELSSVVFYSDDKKLFFVSTDSFRLAEKNVRLNTNEQIPQIIVPVKNAIEIAKVADDFKNDEIEVSLSKGQIMVEVGGVTLISRTVDGSFPDYKQIIPKEFKTEIIVLKEDLARALKASVAFSDKFNQTSFSVSPKNKEVSIKSKSNEVGEGCVNLEASVSGEDIEISFNHKYVIDCLNFIKSDSVSFSFSGDARPALVRGISDHSFRYIVMPMNR